MYPILVHIGLCLVSLPRGSTISSTILMIRCLAPAATPGALGLGVYLKNEDIHKLVEGVNNNEERKGEKNAVQTIKIDIEEKNKYECGWERKRLESSKRKVESLKELRKAFKKKGELTG